MRSKCSGIMTEQAYPRPARASSGGGGKERRGMGTPPRRFGWWAVWFALGLAVGGRRLRAGPPRRLPQDAPAGRPPAGPAGALHALLRAARRADPGRAGRGGKRPVSAGENDILSRHAPYPPRGLVPQELP